MKVCVDSFIVYSVFFFHFIVQIQYLLPLTFLSFTLSNHIHSLVRKEQLSQSLCAVILVLAFSFVPYIDWAAHVGGVIVGFTTGILCFAPWIKTKYCATLWFVVGIILNVVFYSITLSYLYNNVKPSGELKDVCEYYKQFFEDYECNCQINNK